MRKNPQFDYFLVYLQIKVTNLKKRIIRDKTLIM